MKLGATQSPTQTMVHVNYSSDSSKINKNASKTTETSIFNFKIINFLMNSFNFHIIQSIYFLYDFILHSFSQVKRYFKTVARQIP